MNNHFYHIKCVLCHKKTTEEETTSVCVSCGGPLEVIYDYDHMQDQLNRYLLQSAPPKVVKYLDFYPFQERHMLHSLGEGGTNLHHAKNLGKKTDIEKLYIKNEGLNPTGAFKDRGSFVEINKAKQLGFKTVCVASTGNMAASVAAYSAQTGLTCYVFVPENTPKGKLAQAISYGANVIQVRGTYMDAYNLTMEVAKKYKYYLAGDYVFRGEGQKSLSYEICEQLWFGDIDWVVVPVGMGTNLSYIWKGFVEYHRFGLIRKLPKMIAVQATGAAPIVAAFERFRHSERPKGVEESSTTDSQYSLMSKIPPRASFSRDDMRIIPIEKPQTVCSAIAVGDPIDASKVFKALKDSHGIAISVTDDETLRAQQNLAHLEALYLEPSSATTIAAIGKLRKNNTIKKNEMVVCIATGAGLKDPATTLKILAEPPTIEPMLSEVMRVLESGVLSLRAGGVGEREKLLFSKTPSIADVKSVIKKEFRLDIEDDTVKIIRNVISKFIEIKGKTIAKADLQSIIETVTQDEKRDKILEVVDYQIETSKRGKPKAWARVSLKGKTYEAHAEGVGPVDAAIHAITSAIQKTDTNGFKLTDFNVEIPTTGSDATVEVTMVLADPSGTQVVEKGTSPDIIVASIEAYEKGYNELVYQRGKKH